MPFQLGYFILNFIILIMVFLSLDFLIFLLIKQKIRWINIIIFSTSYLIVLFLFFLFYIKKLTLNNFFNYISVELTENLNKVLQSETTKGLSVPEIENIKIFFDFFIIKMIFAYMFLFILVIVFLNYFVVRLFVINRFKIINEVPKFTIWYLDEKVIWFLIIALAMFISNRFLNNEIIYTAAINMIFILGNLYFLIGLSLIFFFMEKYKIPIFMQVFFVFIVFFWNHLSFIIMLIGILDTWINFRKIQKGGNMV